MCHYSAALALNFSERIFAGRRNGEHPGRGSTRSFISGSRTLLEAVEFILGLDQFHKKQILAYCQGLAGRSLEDMQPPPSLDHLANSIPERHWPRLLDSAMRLSFVVLAFAAVGDLRQCDTLVLADFSNAPPYPPQAREAELPIVVDYDNWFRVIGYLLAGRRRFLELDGCSLFSGWGWSLFYDCLADSSPQNVVPGKIWLQKGVPYNNGVIAHRIHDGLNSISTSATWAVELDKAGSTVRPSCATNVKPSRFLVAHHEDVSKRYEMEGVNGFLSVGYLCLSRALWDVRCIQECLSSCENNRHFQQEEKLLLGLGTATMKGFLFWRHGGPRGETSCPPQAPDERIAISLTTGNKHVQWLALVAIYDARQAYELDSDEMPFPRQAVLRCENACAACFL